MKRIQHDIDIDMCKNNFMNPIAMSSIFNYNCFLIADFDSRMRFYVWRNPTNTSYDISLFVIFHKINGSNYPMNSMI